MLTMPKEEDLLNPEPFRQEVYRLYDLGIYTKTERDMLLSNLEGGWTFWRDYVVNMGKCYLYSKEKKKNYFYIPELDVWRKNISCDFGTWELKNAMTEI